MIKLMKGGLILSLLSDRYTILKKLAVTDHTQVYLVKHIKLDTLRVAKVISKQAPDYMRLYREAELIKDLRCQGLPVIYDIEEDNISICIIEEYIAGKSLDAFIKENGQLTIEQIIKIVINICDILEYLHMNGNIAHLDIKPSNIMICNNIDEYNNLVYLIDFDSSRGQETLDSYKSYGTLGYAAPEQYLGNGTTLSDIYSIGVLIVYMTNGGHIQFLKGDIDKQCLQVSKTIRPVIKKCLRHNASQRYKSITALKKDLIKCISGIEHDIHRGIGQNISAQSQVSKKVHIAVAGTRHGIGTSHMCLCIASFLANKGRSALVIKHGDSSDYKTRGLLSCLDSHGVISFGNIRILPEYCGNLNEILPESEYYIHDYGIDLRKQRAHINILVGDVSYRQRDIDIMEEYSNISNIFINHISGIDYYRYIKSYGRQGNYYRMPCCYNPEQLSKYLLQDFEEIFDLYEELTIFKRIRIWIQKSIQKMQFKK